MSKWIFITGGCGYIGSHVAAVIKDNTNYNVMLVDKRAMKLRHTTSFCDMFADEDFSSHITCNAIQDYKPEAVIHLAAKSTVGPSMTNPGVTWQENVAKMQIMLDACANAGVKNVIFASSSSVYQDQDLPVNEKAGLLPASPYATTKLVGEMLLKDYKLAYGINSVSFRFFNVAGAHPVHDLGELNGSSHLLAAIMEGLVHQSPFTVFGRDWNTPDGTAIRDYTHVMDIADAVLKCLSWLPDHDGAHVVNLGGNNPCSVQQVIDTTESLTGVHLPYRYGPRRAGDSCRRASDNLLAKQMLGWSPTRNLNDIILDSIKWYNSSSYTELTNSDIRYEQ